MKFPPHCRHAHSFQILSCHSAFGMSFFFHHLVAYTIIILVHSFYFLKVPVPLPPSSAVLAGMTGLVSVQERRPIGHLLLLTCVAVCASCTLHIKSSWHLSQTGLLACVSATGCRTPCTALGKGSAACTVHSAQLQVQQLHWVIEDVAEKMGK